ncbi:hypothetical protein MUP46_01450 [Patescibacteria group bacterium]|nr:hypothetical protein [Patescibacteria group bacterium]
MDDNLPNPQGDTQNLAKMTTPPTGTPPIPPTTPAPSASVLTPTPTPPPTPPVPSASKPNLMLWISLGILALAAIAGGAYYFLKGTSTKPVPTPVPVAPTPIPTPVDRTTGWLTYTNTKNNFSFKYRPDAKVQEQTDGTINLTLLGPTQKTGTEFFDGLNMTFKPGSLGGLTLKTFVDKKMTVLSTEGVVSATTSATIAQMVGYKFHLETIVPSDYYYLPLGTTSYLEIVDLTRDPSSQGFEQNAQDTLSTITFGVASPSATPAI